MVAVQAELTDRTITHATTLLRLSAHEETEVRKQLARLERDLVRDLTQANLTSFRKDRYERLLKQTRATVRSHYKTIRDTQQEQMEEVARLEGTWTVRALNGAISEPIGVYVDLASVAWTAPQLKAIASNAVIDGAVSREWWAKQAGNTQRIFSDTVKQGLLRGTPTPEIVRELIGTKATNYADGALQMSRNQATTLVRSSISAVAADVRTATYRANSDLINSVSWLSTLDARTTLQWCIPRSGKRYTLDDHTPIGHDLPWKEGPGKIHFNCRSTQVAVLKSWSELAGRTLPGTDDKTVDDLFRSKLRGMGWSEERIAGARRRTQSSMDGQVPRDLDFESWMRTKPAAFQDEVLGKGKADLWRRGLVTSTAQLLNMAGNPLTLKQLRLAYEPVPLPPARPTIGSSESLAEWTTAQSLDDLKTLTRQRWPHITPDFAGLSPDVMRPALQSFEKNAAEWPEAVKQVTYIGSRQDYAWDKGTYAHAAFNPKDQTFMLGLHKEFFGNEAAFVQSLARSEKVNWHPKSTNHVGGVVDHEFGHFIDLWIRSGEIRKASLHPEGWLRASGEPEVRMIFQEWKNQAYRTLKKSKAKKWQLSGYAKMNANEAFAESYAAFRNGNLSSAHTRQLQFLLNAIKKARPGTFDVPAGKSPELYEWIKEFKEALESQ